MFVNLQLSSVFSQVMTIPCQYVEIEKVWIEFATELFLDYSEPEIDNVIICLANSTYVLDNTNI